MSGLDKVNNVPEYAAQYRYIVARLVDGDLWFWGAYGTMERATEAAESIDGLIVINEEGESKDE